MEFDFSEFVMEGFKIKIMDAEVHEEDSDSFAFLDFGHLVLEVVATCQVRSYWQAC